jgi:DNA polymerase III subunit delta'
MHSEGNRAHRAPAALAAATEHQPGARATLAAALRSPSHAYLFHGPPGAGKAAAARAFASELLAAGAADPADARRRALAVPPAHPDLAWISPAGTQHLVEDVRTGVIAAAAYRPFDGERRVFVVDAAEAMAEESQNALLKTLEEPPPFAHLLLLSSEPSGLLETVRSRCQPVRFSPPPLAAVIAELAELGLGADDDERRAAARLAAADRDRAAALLRTPLRELRDAAADLVGAARRGDLGESPWLRLVELAEEAGQAAGAEARARLDRADEVGGAAVGSERERADAVRRAARRGRTDALDLGLALVCAWLRDLAAVAEGAPELALNADRVDRIAADAGGLDPRAARRAGELAMDVRRRLGVNVGEELALEALAFRLEAVLSGT